MVMPAPAPLLPWFVQGGGSTGLVTSCPRHSSSSNRFPRRSVLIVSILFVSLWIPHTGAFSLVTNKDCIGSRSSTTKKDRKVSPRQQQHRRRCTLRSLSQADHDNETSNDHQNGNAGFAGENKNKNNNNNNNKAKILPKLIVFDLDNTLWTPELYQLRNKLPKATKNCDFVPQAGKDVMLFEGAQRLLQQEPSDNSYLPTARPGIALGVASRTKSVEWAHALLGQFQLTSILNHVEIFPGSKKQHFQNIQKASGGLDYKDMLFFDDARDGKYGNCEPIANMGCLTVHTPNGLKTVELFEGALEQYHIWRTQHDALPGCIVEADGTLSLPTATSNDSTSSSDTEQRQVGVVKLLKDRYGFITYRNGPISRDLFFPLNAVVGAGPRSTSLGNRRLLQEGTEVSFVKQRDPRNQGKWIATDVMLEKASASIDEADNTATTRI